MAKKDKIELVSITVKINGKNRSFKKEALSFHGWEAECDMCGSHSGVDLIISDGEASHIVKLGE